MTGLSTCNQRRRWCLWAYCLKQPTEKRLGFPTLSAKFLICCCGSSDVRDACLHRQELIDRTEFAPWGNNFRLRPNKGVLLDALSVSMIGLQSREIKPYKFKQNQFIGKIQDFSLMIWAWEQARPKEAGRPQNKEFMAGAVLSGWCWPNWCMPIILRV